MGNKPFTLIAVALFLVMALLHLLRLLTNFQIVLGSHVMPQWVSVAGLLIAALMSWGLYREAQR